MQFGKPMTYRTAGRAGIFFLASTLTLAACGSQKGPSGAGADRVLTTSGVAPEVAQPPDYDGNPGDILTLTNHGVVDIPMHYESFEQARDWTDVAVLATLQRVSVAKPRPSDPLEAAVYGGLLKVEFSVDLQVGGRETVRTAADGRVLVGLGLDADAELTDKVLARLEGLYGKAQYLLFLNRRVPPNKSEVWYSIDLDTAPAGLLAVWPGDGRLSRVHGEGDLFGAADERGEELTGTSQPPEPPLTPDFTGAKPIGLQVADLETQFVAPIGQPRTPAPLGWDAYLRGVAFLYDNAPQG